MPSTKEEVSSEDKRAEHWVGELKDLYKGKPGFVLGNGWSMSYYGPEKMKEFGVLIGCNRSFEKYPVDYLVWQDKSVSEDILKRYKGMMVCPYKRKSRGPIPLERAYFFTPRGSDPNGLQFTNSGGMALRLAIKMGCKPIFFS